MRALHPAARHSFVRFLKSLLLRVTRRLPAGPASDTEAEARALGEYVLGYCSGSADAHEYALQHLGRFVRTLQITPPGSESDRILEMGAYLQITPALRTRLGYGEVRGSYLGPAGNTDEKTVTSTTGETFRCLVDLFDAEHDRYPYQDKHFSTVVCCELLEHLAEDPMHMLAEVNRILQTGGYFVLSTPNICALRAVASVLERRHPGLYTQFTALKGGNATEPRHAREYAPDEIVRLLDASGFTLTHLETGPYGAERINDYDWTIPLLKEQGFATDLRDEVIHAVARKTGPVKDRYPEWLYAQ